IAKARTCASSGPPTPATTAATSAAAASNPNARVSVTYSATARAAAAINHAIHDMTAAFRSNGYFESTSAVRPVPPPGFGGVECLAAGPASTVPSIARRDRVLAVTAGGTLFGITGAFLA